MYANVAVEEKTGWGHPQLWKSMHPQECGGVYGVGAPVAAE